MKVFFDTEFTGLHKNTSLISLGMIDEDGRTFYAEFLDYDSDQVDDWIKENVIANLKYKTCINNGFKNDSEHFECVGYNYYIKRWLDKWLSEYDKVELVSDCCHYDMVLFIDIFGGAFDLPKNVSPVCHDINQDIAKHLEMSECNAFDISREALLISYGKGFIIEGNKHNALYDAKVIKEIYDLIKYE